MSGGMNRQSKFTPSSDKAAFLLADSPEVISHQAFVGFSIECSNVAAVVTVTIGSTPLVGGAFPETITLVGAGTAFRYPASDQMHKLYNAPFIKVSWDVGTVRIFQKG